MPTGAPTLILDLDIADQRGAWEAHLGGPSDATVCKLTSPKYYKRLTKYTERRCILASESWQHRSSPQQRHGRYCKCRKMDQQWRNRHRSPIPYERRAWNRNLRRDSHRTRQLYCSSNWSTNYNNGISPSINFPRTHHANRDRRLHSLRG
jgi:hypothetical protein